MGIKRFCLSALLMLVIGFLPINLISTPAFSQEEIPERTRIVAEHLRGLELEEIKPGLSATRTRAPNNVELILVRIDPAQYSFHPAMQSVKLGEGVEKIAATEDALIAINGGFFKEDNLDKKSPVGLFRIAGMAHSLAWKTAGGYLVFDEGAVSVIPTLGSPIPQTENVIQSKPALIEPGGKWAMNQNIPLTKKRTLVCLQKNGDVLFMLVVGRGMSLYEAGWLFRDKSVGGVYDCDSALAMDGGGSTQIWFKDREDLSFNTQSRVHNAIIVRAK